MKYRNSRLTYYNMSFIFRTVLPLCVVAFAAAMPLRAQASSDDDVARNLEIFNSVFKYVNSFYVDSLDAEKSIETAIEAMLDGTDPYTTYYPSRESEDFLTISTGAYGGIGSYITESDSKVYISEPYSGSPAARAGLRPGDRIVMVNNDTVTGWNSDKVSEKLKGPPGTQLRLVVARPYCGPDSIKTFLITREKINVNPVGYYGVTRGCLGYISLSTFNEHSYEEVRKALVELKKDSLVKCIVLDVTGNGGGLLESAVQIVSLFVPKGTQVVQLRGRTKQSEKTYKTTEQPVDTNIPLAVMIDGGSASASEITAGALQDLDRAVVVGTRSYGKGLVQSTYSLPYDGLVKVTTAKYYLPSGRLIQEIDYSKDKSKTSAVKADTTAQLFSTRNGRAVKGGAGITPDVKVTYADINRLVYNIIRDRWAFNFACKYMSEHNDEIEDPETFEVTDEMWKEFKEFIDPESFKYDKVCEVCLKELKKAAETEGYMNDSTREAFDKMEQLLKHDLDHDLDQHRKDIERCIASEMLKYKYYQRGGEIYEVRHDATLDRIKELFVKPGEWQSLLSPKK